MSDDSKEIEDVKKGWFRAGILTVLIAFLIPFIIMRITKTGFSVSEIDALGTLGDFFGGSTIGLLTIASIFFIIHTISIQSKELALQRKELKLTRAEMEETRKVHEASNKLMDIQRFETTFFNLMSLHNEIVRNMDWGRDFKGRTALVYMYNQFKNSYNNPSYDVRQKIEIIKDPKEKITELYKIFFSGYGSEIGHYFRNLFRIMKIIDSSQLSNEEKRGYIGILRAQLSSVELKLLFYNCISEHGQSFEDLVIKYDFFDDHLKPEDLLNEMHFDFLN